MQKIKRFLLSKTIGFYLNILSYVNPRKATLLAYRIFSEPRDGRLTKLALPDFLLSAESQNFKFEHDNLQAYYWKGNDHLILLIHGWESNASRWEQLLPYLQKSGSSIAAIDAPAHGLSSGKEFSVPHYAEFIQAAVQKFKPTVLIGHSIGGAACIYFQYKYQNSKLQKMILLGAPSDMKKLASNYIKLLRLSKRTSSLFENHFTEKFNFSLEDFSGENFGKHITLKGIIAHDIHDEVVTFDEGKKIAGSWKNATFIETSGLGHSMHDEQLYQKISNFIFED